MYLMQYNYYSEVEGGERIHMDKQISVWAGIIEVLT